MKQCNVCNEVKEDTEFHKKKLASGNYSLKSLCKSCVSNKAKSKYAEETADDRWHRQELARSWRENNRCSVNALKSKYRMIKKIDKLSSIPHDSHIQSYELHKNRIIKQSLLKHDQHIKEWKSDKARYLRWKHKHNINYMLYQRLKRGIQRALGDNKANSNWSSKLGYTMDELKQNIERQFMVGMGWHNADEWQVDHTIPLCLFNIQSVDSKEFVACFSLHNLRPVWSIDNRLKYNNLDKLLNINKKGTGNNLYAPG